MRDPRVIVALDYPDADSALAFVQRVTPLLCRLKVGNELFTAAGPRLIDALTQRGFEVFLDLKYNDIPNTVAAACRAAARHGIWMLNVHALGGRAMLEAASAAVAGSSHPPLLIAVTVLTSLNERDMREVGIAGAPRDAALKLAQLAHACGLHGVVCSAEEAALLRDKCGAGFRLVTPGIRPAASAQDDQQRVMTPAAAIAAGADYLVVGRPVTQAAEPQAALAAINAEVAGASNPREAG